MGFCTNEKKVIYKDIIELCYKLKNIWNNNGLNFLKIILLN